MALVRTNRVATGYYRHVAVIYAATATKDEIKGYIDGWAQIGTWRVSVTDLPVVKSEQDANVLHIVEGVWRQDIWDRFYGPDRLRLVITDLSGLKLKPLAVVNPVPQNRVLQVHTALDREQ